MFYFWAWAQYLALLFLISCSTKPGNQNNPSPFSPSAKTSTKNIILVIADGMGPSHLALLLAAKPEGAMATFLQKGTMGLVDPAPFSGLVADSASAGTALASGVKTRPRMIGVNPEGLAVESLLEAGKRLGKKTAFVTTSDITDATPASFLAHSTDRLFKKEIVKQILNNLPTVAIGGGSLIIPSPPESLLLKSPMDLPYIFREKRPSLREMIQEALPKIADAQQGYILIVEAARIDDASHEHLAPELLGELLDLDDAVSELLALAEQEQTLLVLTSDHETGGFGFHYRRFADLTPQTLPSGKSWNPRADFGTSKDIEMLQNGKTPLSITWSTYTHTSSLVPIIAIGSDAKRFAGFFAQEKIGQILRDITNAGPPLFLEVVTPSK